MSKNTFEVNQNANLADIGAMVNEALVGLEKGDSVDIVKNILLSIRALIYHNASRKLTFEESAKLAAAEFHSSNDFPDFSCTIDKPIQYIGFIYDYFGNMNHRDKNDCLLLDSNTADTFCWMLCETEIVIRDINKALYGGAA